MSTLQQSTQYDTKKVDGWCHSITENCIHELKNLNKPFKYMGEQCSRCSCNQVQRAGHLFAVTVLLAENNGAGLHTASGAFWDTKRDGES